MKTPYPVLFFLLLSITISAQHQHEAATTSALPRITNIEPQPLLAQALRVSEALSFIGSALPPKSNQQLSALESLPVDERTVEKIQEILDPYCLAMIDINAESRVKVVQGPVRPVLLQDGWTSFLVKVHNQAHITAALIVESPNALPALHRSTAAHRMAKENELTPGQLDNRFLELYMYNDRPLKANLSGIGLEYAVVQIYTRETGKKEAKFGFNVGQGSQDIGFRNTIDILFDIKPAVKVLLNIKDENKGSTMASFIITDGLDRFADSEGLNYFPDDYRLALAMARHWEEPRMKVPTHSLPPEQKLNGIYPLPSRRLAGRDTYPDFFFQPQVYRADGEHVYLPAGKYHVTYGKGPEYKTAQRVIIVPENVDSITLDFQLERWIHMAALGWYSADHHIHAAGCSHYESPEEGVLPEHMWRQIQGEDLNLGSNLTWGPSWYYQKQFFTGKDHPLSNQNTILRYDVEVSGFPSSHAGHIVLLNLKEDDYPGTAEIEQWPSWTLPILQWAKSQGGLTGYAHSGWGLAPVEPTDDFPNFVTPKMDGIGANEYVVTVAHNVIDFYSAGDTPAPAELNMWYHTLNCGFRTRISGETDFPCISDERVGRARIYAKLDKLDFPGYMDAIKKGKSYVSDGFSHLIDFKVNSISLGEENSEVKAPANATLNIEVKAAALLTEKQDEIGAIIAARSAYQSPYWHIERSRIGTSRKIPVELIVNGYPVEKQDITADGNWETLKFNYKVTKSSWVAIRVYQSAHTNPIFVIVDGKPIRDKESATWCRTAVDQCWKMKMEKFRKEELPAAEKAYDYARKVYDDIAQAK
ncbi:MAG: CehA/McbA family metallohydrolase [Cyclobacteriaceae bacterium]|nr:CehA/McbA family metallohydrolase [Cyclobacteriaceae bacterium]MDH5249452.1 CehA/McbA family metallohydrolase [Cyclobacteriaceae bacterium]